MGERKEKQEIRGCVSMTNSMSAKLSRMVWLVDSISHSLFHEISIKTSCGVWSKNYCCYHDHHHSFSSEKNDQRWLYKLPKVTKLISDRTWTWNMAYGHLNLIEFELEIWSMDKVFSARQAQFMVIILNWIVTW